MIRLAEELNKRKIQLNEKVNANGDYDVLYPETIAEQVITNESYRFVSDEDIAKWNALISGSPEQLSYKGAWLNSENYSVNDLVYYNDKFYIAIIDNIDKTPSEVGDNDYWITINKEAILADKSDSIKVLQITTNDNYELAFIDSSVVGDYKTVYYAGESLTYNPSTKTLIIGSVKIDGTNGIVEATEFKGKLTGKADEADKYIEYNVDESGNRTATGNKPFISDTIEDLKETIKNIQGGGTTLQKSLTIKVEGRNDVVFDGSVDQTVGTIKQVYNTADITDLLENTKTKIDTKWLPDSILGQLEYQGTWDPSSDGLNDDLSIKGHYYIASKSGNRNPDGSVASGDNNYYQTGDWAVCRGKNTEGKGIWDKVDNTDAVTMVNSQIGAIETYKGVYTIDTKYYKGDIVSYSPSPGVIPEALYLCVAEVKNINPSSSTYWKVFGKIYNAADGIKLDGDTFKHDVDINPNITNNGSQELKPNENFSVYEPVRDDYGHVKEVKKKIISLSSDFVDTVRPIAIVGDTVESVFSSTDKSTLHFHSSNKIDLEYVATGNKGIKILHKNPVESESTIILTHDGGEIGAGGSFQVPSFKVDSTGHITIGALKTYTVGLADIAHSHFAITTNGNTKTIGAFSASDFSGLADKNLKFYLGSEVPTSTSQMNFNGYFNATKLLQSGNGVLDNTLKIYQGKDYPSATMDETGVAQDLYTQYNTVNKRFEMAKILNFEDSENIVYSAVNVNNRGLVTAGGQIVEFGTAGQTEPSGNLVVGGLFFRHMGAVTA